ncbi:hypothetical protein ACMGDK_11475 [Chryseobacterium sp. DT-3]|uniref:hypothetical protein n=1 Tax=Chryseobacterium sp. DT-3 TaxID=3396164 RepID=UPI003F1A3252
MNSEQQNTILRFDKQLVKTHINPKHIVTVDNKRVVYRLAKGEPLAEKEQSEHAEPYRLYISSQEMIFDDNNEVEFLKSKPYFGSLITEYDPSAEHKKNNEIFNLTVDTFVKVRALEESEMRGIGYRLFGIDALKIDLKDLENRIQTKVNEDPEKVSKMLDEKNDTEYALIGLAMAKDIIHESDAGNTVRFTDTEELITSVAQHQNPIDSVAELFKSSEGREIKKRIYQKLQPSVVDDIKDAKTATVKDSKTQDKK